MLFPLYDRYLNRLPAGTVDARMLSFEIVIFAEYVAALETYIGK